MSVVERWTIASGGRAEMERRRRDLYRGRWSAFGDGCRYGQVLIGRGHAVELVAGDGGRCALVADVLWAGATSRRPGAA